MTGVSWVGRFFASPNHCLSTDNYNQLTWCWGTVFSKPYAQWHLGFIRFGLLSWIQSRIVMQNNAEISQGFKVFIVNNQNNGWRHNERSSSLIRSIGCLRHDGNQVRPWWCKPRKHSYPPKKNSNQQLQRNSLDISFFCCIPDTSTAPVMLT